MPGGKAQRRVMAFVAIQQHMGAGQRGMAAELDFAGRGEPTQFVDAVRWHQKSGFGEIVFGRDCDECGIVEPLLQHHYGRGIAFENGAGERVDLIVVQDL